MINRYILKIGGHNMKTTVKLFSMLIISILLYGCSATYSSNAPLDDAYYNPYEKGQPSSKPIHKRANTTDNQMVNGQQAEQSIADSSYYYENGAGRDNAEGNSYDEYTDYSYSTQIQRFYSDDYYGQDYYYEDYYGYPVEQVRYYPSYYDYGCGWSFGWSFYMGWGYPYYGYPSYGYPYYGYPYYNDYWYGYNDGYYDGYNDGYYGSDYRPGNNTYFGPRNANSSGGSSGDRAPVTNNMTPGSRGANLASGTVVKSNGGGQGATTPSGTRQGVASSNSSNPNLSTSAVVSGSSVSQSANVSGASLSTGQTPNPGFNASSTDRQPMQKPVNVQNQQSNVSSNYSNGSSSSPANGGAQRSNPAFQKTYSKPVQQVDRNAVRTPTSAPRTTATNSPVTSSNQNSRPAYQNSTDHVNQANQVSQNRSYTPARSNSNQRPTNQSPDRANSSSSQSKPQSGNSSNNNTRSYTPSRSSSNSNSSPAASSPSRSSYSSPSSSSSNSSSSSSRPSSSGSSSSSGRSSSSQGGGSGAPRGR